MPAIIPELTLPHQGKKFTTAILIMDVIALRAVGVASPYED
jgi:hypothetical protein